MRYFLIALLFACFLACQRKEDNVRENNDYVLVEFAAKLEEDQEKFQKLQKSPTDP